MKTNSNFLAKLSRGVLLGVIGAALCVASSRACSFELFVYPYNGTTAALVVPGSNLGGRVVWSDRYGDYITDRVVRGERLFAILRPSTALEVSNPVILRANVHSYGNGQTFGIAATPTLTAVSPI